jgi:hypothetical protein
MRSLIKAVFRVILVFLFINLVIQVVNYISQILLNSHIYATASEKFNVFPYIIGACIAFVVFSSVLLFLWWKTNGVVKFIAGDVTENEVAITTTNSELHRTIMRFLGIYLIVSNVPYIAGTLGYYYYYVNVSRPALFDWQTSEIRQLIIQGITVLLGIWLVVGNYTIKKVTNKIINGIKNYIQPPPPNDDKKE